MEYITHCGKNGVEFNPDKFYFAENMVELAEFLVTADGVKPKKKMTEAILQFSTPTNITSIRSWFGLVNQVSYAFSQAWVMTSFGKLLRSRNRKFYWVETLEQLFEGSRLLTEDGVKTFEISRRTCLFNRNQLLSFSKTL